MPMRYSPELLRIDPFRRIRHIPGQPVTYLQNPKVACTSIELTLWKAHDCDGVPQNPHGMKVKPFLNKATKPTEQEIERLLGSSFFSVVRNPFARLLSAYLDKVGSRRRPWRRICRSLGLSPDSDPSLGEFLSALRSCDPYKVDHHFRPQNVNLLHGFAPQDFIGHMECMEEVYAFLGEHGFTMERYDRHATNAASRIAEYIGPHDAGIIRSFYQRDFEIYGYSQDPGQIPPVRKPSPIYANRMPLRRFLERGEPVRRRSPSPAEARHQPASGSG